MSDPQADILATHCGAFMRSHGWIESLFVSVAENCKHKKEDGGGDKRALSQLRYGYREKGEPDVLRLFLILYEISVGGTNDSRGILIKRLIGDESSDPYAKCSGEAFKRSSLRGKPIMIL